MKKQDVVVLVVLLALWLSWPWIDRHFVTKLVPPKEKTPTATVEKRDTPVGGELKAAEPRSTPTPPVTPEAASQAATLPVEADSAWREPGQTGVLQSDLLALEVSSHGAAILSAELKKYRQTVKPDSAPVVLDFKDHPVLQWKSPAGFFNGVKTDLTSAPDGRAVQVTFRLPSGLHIHRSIQLVDNYILRVSDTFTNTSAAHLALPQLGVRLGSMRYLYGEKPDNYAPGLGVDTFVRGGEGIQFLATRFAKWFAADSDGRDQPATSITQTMDRIDWVAVKNRYFTQILAPEEDTGYTGDLTARRAAEGGKNAPANWVAATLYFPEQELQAGAAYTRSMQLYLGPKKYSELQKFGRHGTGIMEFASTGFWSWANAFMVPLRVALLWLLNAGHTWIWPHSYGLAIMLLTLLVRIVFWPMTHKSTESMKRMAEVQPLVTALREKHKDNPQKQQQEMMRIYKENKVNPLGGCLPMLVQIPVFIALFTILRNAIELRFASWLWVADLSAPENLLAGRLPFGLSLNILPILMAVTMVWQQKLTPSTGDPQQQKMMAIMMPAMMLFFFYNFASGLSLYWTTSQVLMIVQLYWQKYQREHHPAPIPTGARR